MTLSPYVVPGFLTRSAQGSVVKSHLRQRVVILVNLDRDNKETPKAWVYWIPLSNTWSFWELGFFFSITGKNRLYIEAANVTKTCCVTKQVHIWQVLASAEQAVTLEGADRNVAALSELRGKYWLQKLFFFFLFLVRREKSIFQSPSQGFGCFFFLSVCILAMWNRFRVTPGKN